MGYSRISYTWQVGQPVQFDTNFALGYLDKADVSVYIVGKVDGEGNQIFETFEWISDTTVRLNNIPVENCTVVLQRTQSKQVLPVDFTAGGTSSRDALDTAFKHAIMVYHELLDERLVDRSSTAPVPREVVEMFINADYLGHLNSTAGEENDYTD